jgi:hypothetical protein
MDAYKGDSSYDASSMRIRAAVRALREQALAERKSGRYLPYTEDHYNLLRLHASRHVVTPAFARDWNNLLGGQIVVMDPWERELYVLPPPHMRNGHGYVLAAGFKPMSTPTKENIIEGWTRSRNTVLSYSPRGLHVYADRYGETQYFTDCSSQQASVNSCGANPLLLEYVGFELHTMASLLPQATSGDDPFWDAQDAGTASINPSLLIAITPGNQSARDTAQAFVMRNARTNTSRIQMGGRHSSHAYLVGQPTTVPGEWNLGLEWETGVQSSAHARDYVLATPRAHARINDADRPREVSVLQTVCAFRRASGVNSYAYAEHDGTVPDGYELVFGYRGLGEHKRLFDKAVELDARHPWLGTLATNYRAGIHVHIGRTTHDRSMSYQQITMMANIVHWVDNRAFINTIARRDIGATSYLHVPSSRNRSGIVGMPNKRCSTKLQSHYVPVNMRSETVELRIFASGMHEEALEAMEWAEALACYTHEACQLGRALIHASKRHLHWTRFADYVKSNAERWPLAMRRIDGPEVQALVTAHKEALAAQLARQEALRSERRACRIAPVPSPDRPQEEADRVYLDSAVHEPVAA